MNNENFIDRAYIEGLLAQPSTEAQAGRALDKAERMEGLSHKDVAAILGAAFEPGARVAARLLEIAGKIKKRIYGDRIVMFAPLYVSNHCENSCEYCAFSAGHEFKRRRLTLDEVRAEALALQRMGHKRIALEAGEHDEECSIDYILDCIKAIYEAKYERGEIRRINVNIAATGVENYRRLKEAGIGTYILFQETYHEPTYALMHPAGPKSDFARQLCAFDRANEAGLDDVGGGALFGLADPRFEVMGLLLHNERLEKKYGAGFHTVSVPRLRPAEGSGAFERSRPVGDDEFEKIVAILRVALPYAGIILSTRENRAMRKRLLKAGVSQLSAGSSVEVGGYSRRERGAAASPLTEPEATQFNVSDERSALSVISDILDDGYLPSFCTACYRSGRTGDRFMELAKSGEIGNVCLPNALMTLHEYAGDYGDEEFRRKAAAFIEAELPGVANEATRRAVEKAIAKMRAGAERDFYL
ncbi:MAG: [FeFe] hydrogenase H-cluster radical SAM maturase HydG [Treponema sp.]|nr:[FeFe] hydrogenase H-cluster radical SAM maturase HydG [Treponema sp.]